MLHCYVPQQAGRLKFPGPKVSNEMLNSSNSNYVAVIGNLLQKNCYLAQGPL